MIINKQLKARQSQMLSMRLLVILLLTVIIFLLSASFISSNKESIVSSAQDVACRGFLQTYHNLGDKLNTAAKLTNSRNLFSEIGRFCKTDRLIFTSTDKEYVQERYAKASRRCYERYGSGELEFLDFTQREGSYCFVCAEIEFEENDEQEVYKYREIGEWMSETVDPEKNEDKESYRDLANLFYITADQEYSAQNFPTVQDLELEESTIEDYGEGLSEINQFVQYLKDTYTREITTTEKSYIVFRYNAEGLSFSQIAKGAAYTAGGVFAVKKGACFLSGLAITGAGALTSWTGVGAGVAAGGLIKTATCVTKTVRGGAKLVKVAFKISKFITKLPPLKIAGVGVIASSVGGSTPSADVDIDPENPQTFIDAIQNRELVISNRVKNQLDKENKELLESIKNGEVTLQPDTRQGRGGNSQKVVGENEVQELILVLVELEVQELQQQGEIPDFKQYTEIIPESEFYRQCGVVPQSRLN